MILPLRRRLYKKAVVTRSCIPIILQCMRYGHVRISFSNTKVKVNFLGSGSRMNVLPSQLVRRLYNPLPPPPNHQGPTYPQFILQRIYSFFVYSDISPFLPPLIKPQKHGWIDWSKLRALVQY